MKLNQVDEVFNANMVSVYSGAGQAVGKGEGRGRVTHDSACRSRQTNYLASPRWVFDGPTRDHQARSVMVASPERGRLHPSEIIRPEANPSSCAWIVVSKEMLRFLVSPLPATATGYPVSWVPHHVNTTLYDNPLRVELSHAHDL